MLLFPAALICLLASRNKKGILLFLVASLAVAVIFYSQSYLRYVYPMTLILTAVIGIAISGGTRESALIAEGFTYAAIFTVEFNLLFFHSGDLGLS